MLDDDVSLHLARYIAACRYEHLSPDAVDKAKKSVLDLLGVILAAGGTVPAVRAVMEIVRGHGGEPQCSVLGFGDRVPPLMAAFANGAMAHCLDFDDVAPDGNHASSSLIPAIFAAAEYRGGISGKEMITAVAIGQDVFLRLRRSLVGQRLDWLTTTVLGVFSATAGASYALGLNSSQIANALGIASLGSCGTLEIRFGTGSDLGELYAGFLAKSAVLSALLAKNGVTGTQRVFEGQAGIMKVYFGGQYDRAKILDDLGNRFDGASMQYKPWPVCGIANTYIHAVLELVREHNLKAEEIKEIRAYVGDFQQRMSYPLDERRNPTCSMDARFSLPFCLAVAATHGDVRIEHLTEEGIRNPKVLAMAGKVNPVDDSSLDWRGNMPDARVEIDTVSDQTFEGNGNGTPGSIARPMDWDDITSKFFKCAGFAAKPKSPDVISKAASMGRSLEQLGNATDIVRLLS